MNNTCINQTCIRGDCRTCQYKPELSNLQIETQHAEELLGNLFAGGLVVTAIGLIILTAIYL
ncbi:MAG TPA: hypothetical protein ACFYEK_05995 [Candidatus Wunengus sp. YC60]|uniref:hypothetical protein n=1 Tax=Candidatus Wunengus sp. YC60 TaxID=3367697 RepID=UPI004028F97E